MAATVESYARRYLNHCFAQGATVRASELAAEMSLSPSTLSRRFARETGTSLSFYLKSAQLAHAQDLLKTTDLPLTAIARAAGFGTANTLFTAFRRHLGTTPSAFRYANNDTRRNVHRTRTIQPIHR